MGLINKRTQKLTREELLSVLKVAKSNSSRKFFDAIIESTNKWD
jgi:hypothetical protein